MGKRMWFAVVLVGLWGLSAGCGSGREHRQGPTTEATSEPAKQVAPKEEPPKKVEGQITEEKARAIASAKLKGTITDVAIEEKLGKTTYVVEMQTKDGEMDVVIDIQTGEVLAIEQ